MRSNDPVIRGIAPDGSADLACRRIVRRRCRMPAASNWPSIGWARFASAVTLDRRAAPPVPRQPYGCSSWRRKANRACSTSIVMWAQRYRAKRA